MIYNSVPLRLLIKTTKNVVCVSFCENVITGQTKTNTSCWKHKEQHNFTVQVNNVTFCCSTIVTKFIAFPSNIAVRVIFRNLQSTKLAINESEKVAFRSSSYLFRYLKLSTGTNLHHSAFTVLQCLQPFQCFNFSLFAASST